jgi:hypothetical protein
MNAFIATALTFLTLVLAIQCAGIYADHTRTMDAHARAVAYDTASHARLVAQCAAGKTSHIMVDGKLCEK